MIEKEAIDRIVNLGNLTGLATLLGAAAERAIALPGDFKIHDIEKIQPYRARARGKFSTTAIEDFCAYEGATAESAPEVFIDQENMRALAIYNLLEDGRPGHCDDTALLALQKTAAFTAMLDIMGQRCDQRTLAEFLEDWRGFLTAEAGGEELEMGHAITAVRNLTIEAVRKRETSENDFSSSADTFDRIEANSQGRQLPSYLTFHCHPYHGLSLRDITLRLSLTTGSDKPMYTLRATAFEEVKEQMAMEFADLVRRGLDGKSATVRIGTFDAK